MAVKTWLAGGSLEEWRKAHALMLAVLGDSEIVKQMEAVLQGDSVFIAFTAGDTHTRILADRALTDAKISFQESIAELARMDEEQRNSFAFGSTNLHNPIVTKELVEEVANAGIV